MTDGPLIVDDSKPSRDLAGSNVRVVDVAAAAVGGLAVWQVFLPLSLGSQYYLMIFLAMCLPLVFVVYPAGLRMPLLLPRPWRRAPRPGAVPVTDWVLAGAAAAVCLYPLLPFLRGGYDGFLERQGLLDPIDTLMGAVLLVLLLEACRRTTGWALPAICLVFLGYAYYGGLLPSTWSLAHTGLDLDQIIDALYNSGSGFFGTPLDVAASYIVLFGVYGAVLERTGASAFFVQLSVCAFRRSRSAAGRTAVASGFLLGTVSGSGAATTASIGAVTWPILRRAGYSAERAGGMLAAAGVGAILSPPTLGAAAFLIAELLEVSYLQVLVWATAPTILYYLALVLAVEIDARRLGMAPVHGESTSPWRLLARCGYHLSSLVLVVLFMLAGQTATRAVVYAAAAAALLSVLDRRHRLGARRAVSALAAGVRGVLPVVAVCAAAGVITAVTTKTGLGPQAASLIISGAHVLGDHPVAVTAVTAALAAVTMALLGLAVPVTASFIIGWVVIGPAMIGLDIAAPAAAMFVFYYAVLSEATPPTALAAVAAAAITGGRLLPTMWQTLRYTMPAFLVPMAFVLSPGGAGLLGLGGPLQVGYALAVSALGVTVLSVAVGGWVPTIGLGTRAERAGAGIAALMLLWVHPVATAAGLATVFSLALAVLLRRHLKRESPMEVLP